MNFEYETERLRMKLLKPTLESAKQVLEFHSKNRIIFERYEATRPSNFYTALHQKSLLEYEYNLAIQQKCIRFWAFLKSDPSAMIGTVCFYNILRAMYERCELGYKFDRRHWHNGYAKEALAFGIDLMFGELGLHRIEAYVMEQNAASIRLLSRLNFECEGICRKSARIRGKWEDHMLFAKLKDLK